MRKLLVLLLVIGALVAVLWSTKQKPDERHVVSVPVLAGHRLGEATAIRWKEAGKTIEVRRDTDGRWWVREPIVDLCSRAHLVAIASAFDSAMMAEAFQQDARTEPQKLLEETGLAPPVVTFTAEFPDGKLDLDIGGEGALGADRYLRRDGKIYLGGTGLYSALQVNSEDLRERQVFSNDPATVSSVAVDNLLPSGKRELFRIERGGDGFRMTSPVTSRTDRAMTQRYLDLLLRMRIDQFPASVARFPDRPPDVVVEVDGGFGVEKVPFWRNEQNRLLGRLDDRKLAFVVLDIQYHTIFDNAAGALRARLLLPFERVHEQVTRVVVDPGQDRGQRLLLERNATGFRIAEPVLAQTNPTPVNELLQALNNCRVIEFVPGKGNEPQFGLQQALAVQVRGQADEGGLKEVTLKFGADQKRGDFDVTFCVRSDEPDQVVTVPAAAVQQLRRVWTDYVAKAALKIDGAVGQLRAERSNGNKRIFQLRDGRWQREPDHAPLATPDVITDGIKDLVGERVFSAKQMALGEPDWTLHVARENGDELARIRVWERGKGQPVLVQPANQPELLYEVKDWVGDFLRALWLD